MYHHRIQTPLLWSLCHLRYNKQRIGVEEVDEVGGVAEEEVAQSGFHSAWLRVAVNLVDN
jgi:hypothetical protein